MEPDDRAFAVFLEIYGTLHRAGPGADEHTRRALRLVPGPPPRTVLDLGCGPGAQTVALASALTEARIVAVDRLPSMVGEPTVDAERPVSTSGWWPWWATWPGPRWPLGART